MSIDTCPKGCVASHLHGMRGHVFHFGDFSGGRRVVAHINARGEARFSVPRSGDVGRADCDPWDLSADQAYALADMVGGYGDDRLAGLLIEALEAVSPETVVFWGQAKGARS